MNAASPRARRIAIACQGGGSHTAFTAGALKPLLQAHQRGEIRIVALSGTSGGAICAMLAWSRLVTADSDAAIAALDAFWTSPYPHGNATTPWPDIGAAWLTALWGGAPPLSFLPMLDRWRNDVGVALSRQAWPSEFFFLRPGVNPYALRRWLEDWDRLPLNPLAQGGAWADGAMLAAIQALAALPPPWSHLDRAAEAVRELTHLMLPHVFHDGPARQEWDTQEALRAIITRHLSDDDLQRLRQRLASSPDLPELLVGAVDVLHAHPYPPGAVVPPGQSPSTVLSNFKVFRASHDPGRLREAVVASAAIPEIMRGVSLDGTVYWDGLFSQNPPITELPDVHGPESSDRNPEEIWVIQVNPSDCAVEPKTADAIADRRNELAGNISLQQQMHTIIKMNGAQIGNRVYQPIAFKTIGMDPAFIQGRVLDAGSKFDRRPEFLRELMDHGGRQAQALLSLPAETAMPP